MINQSVFLLRRWSDRLTKRNEDSLDYKEINRAKDKIREIRIREHKKIFKYKFNINNTVYNNLIIKEVIKRL